MQLMDLSKKLKHWPVMLNYLWKLTRLLFRGSTSFWLSTRYTRPKQDAAGEGAYWGLMGIWASFSGGGGNYTENFKLSTHALSYKTSENNSKTSGIRPIIEIPLSSFTMYSTEPVSMYDYEITPISN